MRNSSWKLGRLTRFVMALSFSLAHFWLLRGSVPAESGITPGRPQRSNGLLLKDGAVIRLIQASSETGL